MISDSNIYKGGIYLLDNNYTGITKLKDWWGKVKANFTYLDERISTIITTPAEGVSAQEIIDARKGETTLGDKIDAMDAAHASHLAENMSLSQFPLVIPEVDDTGRFQRAFAAVMERRGKLTIPVGHYEVSSDLMLNFTDADASGVTIEGERGVAFHSITDVGAKSSIGATIEFTKDSGTLLSVSGSIGSAVKGVSLINLTLVGKADAIADATPAYGKSIQNTAVGLNLSRVTNSYIENVHITGFDIGLKTDKFFSNTVTRLSTIQNNYGCIFDSATNATPFVGCQFHQNYKTNLIFQTTIGINPISKLTFYNCTLEGNSRAILLNPQNAIIKGVSFIDPYFEQNNILVESGYDLAGVESLSSTYGLYFNTVTTSGGTAPFFKLNNTHNIRIDMLLIDSDAEAFEVTDSVSNISIGSTLSTPVLLSQEKSNQHLLGRKIPYNLFLDGEFKRGKVDAYVSNAAAITNVAVVDETMEITCASGGALAYLEWIILNANQLEGTILSLESRFKLDAGFSHAFIRLYDAGGVQIPYGTLNLLTANNPIAFTSIGTGVRDLPNTAHIKVRLYLQKDATGIGKAYFDKIFITQKQSGDIIPSPYDLLAKLAGSVVCSPTAIVNVPYLNANGYEVIVTPYATGLNPYVTKANNTFTITCAINGTVGYFVIPTASVTVL